ncbi:unnamed protein product [Amoebophrya sp. A120]|nr:unnamed protein product [Amoebophrya sp. A120]|eukprot:GSA120T00014793001.1
MAPSCWFFPFFHFSSATRPFSLLRALCIHFVLVLATPAQQATAAPSTTTATTSACRTPLRDGVTEQILITGGTGMIGSQLVKHAVDNCEFGSAKNVIVLARWRSNLRNLKGYVHRIQLEYGDVTDSFFVTNLLKKLKPDYVFHFAAQAINGVSFGSASLSLNVNIIGTLNVLEAVRVLQNSGDVSKEMRILVAGSSAEYGAAAIDWEGTPIPETAHLKPFTPYGVSKVAQENLAMMYATTYNLKTIVARIFIQMAEGGTDQLSLQNFAKQIAELESQAEREREDLEHACKIKKTNSNQTCSATSIHPEATGRSSSSSNSNYTLYHGDLSTSRDVTDVADSAPVFLKLCRIGKPGEAYNVGSGIGYTIKDMLQLLTKEAKIPINLEFDRSRLRSADEKTLLADNSKLRKLTGWVPNPNITVTANNILQHWREEVAMRNGQ